MTRRSRVGGFTLLELLVVMALLSVVMLALGSALRTIAQSEERIDRRLVRADEFRVASAFIRTTLERISARKVAAPATTEGSPLLFAAAPDAVAWVGIMPARYGAGGRHFFRLGVESVNGEAALVLRFAPWVDSPTFPDWSQAESLVLVTRVTSLSIRYEDARVVPSVWGAEWLHKDVLPARIDLVIDTDVGAWPNLVVAMRAFAEVTQSVFSTGGGR